MDLECRHMQCTLQQHFNFMVIVVVTVTLSGSQNHLVVVTDKTVYSISVILHPASKMCTVCSSYVLYILLQYLSFLQSVSLFSAYRTLLISYFHKLVHLWHPSAICFKCLNNMGNSSSTSSSLFPWQGEK
jgi:hypothetical protein